MSQFRLYDLIRTVSNSFITHVTPSATIGFEAKSDLVTEQFVSALATLQQLVRVTPQLIDGKLIYTAADFNAQKRVEILSEILQDEQNLQDKEAILKAYLFTGEDGTVSLRLRPDATPQEKERAQQLLSYHFELTDFDTDGALVIPQKTMSALNDFMSADETVLKDKAEALTQADDIIPTHAMMFKTMTEAKQAASAENTIPDIPMPSIDHDMPETPEEIAQRDLARRKLAEMYAGYFEWFNHQNASIKTSDENELFEETLRRNTLTALGITPPDMNQDIDAFVETLSRSNQKKFKLALTEAREKTLDLMPPKALLDLYHALLPELRKSGTEEERRIIRERVAAVSERMNLLISEYVVTPIGPDYIGDLYDGLSAILKERDTSALNILRAKMKLEKEIKAYDQANNLADLLPEDGPYLSQCFQQAKEIINQLPVPAYLNNLRFTTQDKNASNDKDTAERTNFVLQTPLISEVVKSALLTETVSGTEPIGIDILKARIDELYDLNTVALLCANLNRKGEQTDRAFDILDELKKGNTYYMPAATLAGWTAAYVNHNAGVINRLADKIGEHQPVLRDLHESMNNIDTLAEKRFKETYPKTSLAKTVLKRFGLGAFGGALAGGAGMAATMAALPAMPVIAGAVAGYTAIQMWHQRKKEVKAAQEQRKPIPTLGSFFKKNTVRALLTGVSLSALAAGLPALGLGIGVTAAALSARGIFKRNRKEGFGFMASIIRTIPESTAALAGSLTAGGSLFAVAHDTGFNTVYEQLADHTAEAAQNAQTYMSDLLKINGMEHTLQSESFGDASGTDGSTDTGTDGSAAEGIETPAPEAAEDPIAEPVEEDATTIQPEAAAATTPTPEAIPESAPAEDPIAEPVEEDATTIQSEAPAATTPTPEATTESAPAEDPIAEPVEEDATTIQPEAPAAAATTEAVSSAAGKNFHTYDAQTHTLATQRLLGEGVYAADGSHSVGPDGLGYTRAELETALNQIRAIGQDNAAFTGSDGQSNADILMYKLNQLTKLTAENTDVVIDGHTVEIQEALGVKTENGYYSPHDLRTDLLSGKPVNPETAAQILNNVEHAVDNYGRLSLDVDGFSEQGKMSYAPDTVPGYQEFGSAYEIKPVEVASETIAHDTAQTAAVETPAAAAPTPAETPAPTATETPAAEAAEDPIAEPVEEDTAAIQPEAAAAPTQAAAETPTADETGTPTETVVLETPTPKMADEAMFQTPTTSEPFARSFTVDKPHIADTGEMTEANTETAAGTTHTEGNTHTDENEGFVPFSPYMAPTPEKIITVLKQRMGSFSELVQSEEDKAAASTKEKTAEPETEKTDLVAPAEDKAAASTKEKAAEPETEKTDIVAPVEDKAAAGTKEKAAEPETEKTDLVAPAEEKAAASTKEKAAEPEAEKTDLAAPAEEKAAASTKEKAAEPETEKTDIAAPAEKADTLTFTPTASNTPVSITFTQNDVPSETVNGTVNFSPVSGQAEKAAATSAPVSALYQTQTETYYMEKNRKTAYRTDAFGNKTSDRTLSPKRAKELLKKLTALLTPAQKDKEAALRQKTTANTPVGTETARALHDFVTPTGMATQTQTVVFEAGRKTAYQSDEFGNKTRIRPFKSAKVLQILANLIWKPSKEQAPASNEVMTAAQTDTVQTPQAAIPATTPTPTQEPVVTQEAMTPHTPLSNEVPTTKQTDTKGHTPSAHLTPDELQKILDTKGRS